MAATSLIWSLHLPGMRPSGWSARFDDPIVLPDGRELVTLKDAAGHVTKLPKAEQLLEEWQTAIHCLIVRSFFAKTIDIEER